MVKIQNLNNYCKVNLVSWVTIDMIKIDFVKLILNLKQYFIRSIPFK